MVQRSHTPIALSADISAMLIVMVMIRIDRPIPALPYKVKNTFKLEIHNIYTGISV